MPVLNTNIRVGNLYVGSPRWKCCTKHSQRFYFTSWCAYIQPTLSAFSLLMCREIKRNYGALHLFLSFYTIIFSLIQGGTMSKERCGKFLCPFIFLRMSLPSCFETNYGSQEKAWPPGAVGTLSPPWFLSCGCKTILNLLWVSLSSHTTWSTIFVSSWGITNTEAYRGAAQSELLHIQHALWIYCCYKTQTQR